MHNTESFTHLRVQYEGLLEEAREVAERVRARLDDLRRQFPDDESLARRPEEADDGQPDEWSQEAAGACSPRSIRPIITTINHPTSARAATHRSGAVLTNTQ